MAMCINYACYMSASYKFFRFLETYSPSDRAVQVAISSKPQLSVASNDAPFEK